MKKKIEILLVLPSHQQQKNYYRQSYLKYFHLFLFTSKLLIDKFFFRQKKSETKNLPESFLHDFLRSECSSI